MCDGKLPRPKFSALKITLNIALPLAIAAVIAFVMGKYVCLNFTAWYFIVLGAYIILRLGAITIFLVRVYQRFAPEHVRGACLFTPTCSEYMILSIKKYGFIIGIIKGIKRLNRCKYPNGGVDYP